MVNYDGTLVYMGTGKLFIYVCQIQMAPTRGSKGAILQQSRKGVRRLVPSWSAIHASLLTATHPHQTPDQQGLISRLKLSIFAVGGPTQRLAAW